MKLSSTRTVLEGGEGEGWPVLHLMCQTLTLCEPALQHAGDERAAEAERHASGV